MPCNLEILVPLFSGLHIPLESHLQIDLYASATLIADPKVLASLR